jgi:hypothetical protein
VGGAWNKHEEQQNYKVSSLPPFYAFFKGLGKLIFVPMLQV